MSIRRIYERLNQQPKADVRLRLLKCRQMFYRTSAFLLVVGFAIAPASYASDPVPIWSPKWSAHVWNTYCALNLEYEMPFKNDRQRRGVLAGRSLDRMFIAFSASTSTYYDRSAEYLGKIRFGLFVYGEDGHVPADDDRLVLARIDELELDREDTRNDWIESFSMSESDSLLLLERLSDNETVVLTMQFADGERIESKIYASGDRDFHVWAAMFRTCIRESVD